MYRYTLSLIHSTYNKLVSGIVNSECLISRFNLTQISVVEVSATLIMDGCDISVSSGHKLMANYTCEAGYKLIVTQ